ncbi:MULTISPECIES: hypothetical protein [unclassified Streptomyces]|uniref:hypothetical protein n=1 Tax=unclassified Streptomyces TaxID=2593676 RepID=UPI0033BE4EFF
MSVALGVSRAVGGGHATVSRIGSGFGIGIGIGIGMGFGIGTGTTTATATGIGSCGRIGGKHQTLLSERG